MTDQLYGWLAAAIATLGFGSFAVPIKSEAADSVDVDPLVMQSYKSGMCFLTSWMVLLMGEFFRMSPSSHSRRCYDVQNLHVFQVYYFIKL